MQFKSAGFSHRGAIRVYNEDALLDAADAGVWVVADGMGGHKAGKVASQLVCDTVACEVDRAGPMLTVETLEQALYRANHRVLRYSAETLQGQILGSTVVALLIAAGRYHLFWAGDSRCYLARGHSMTQISHDHTQVEEMVGQGLLRRSEAERHPLAHVITRALGVDEAVVLDYRAGDVSAGDVFLLCSDGVSKEFSREDLGFFLTGGEVEEASLAILHSALVKECSDNVTCIIVNVSDGCYSGCESIRSEDATLPIRFR